MGNVIRFPTAAPAAGPRVARTPDKRAPELGIVDRLIGAVWLTASLIGPFVRFPLGVWTFIELIRIAWGHPAWHAGAYFALLVFIYWFTGVYVPKGEKGMLKR